MGKLRRLFRSILLFQLRRASARVRRQRHQLRCLERGFHKERDRHWRAERMLRHQYRSAQEKKRELESLLAALWTIAEAGDLEEVVSVTAPFACAQGVVAAQRFIDHG